MNRGPPPFWKQPKGIALLGLAGVLLVATGWLAIGRLGPSPPPSEAYAPRPRIDENALIAANAERQGGPAAAAPAANETAVEAAADDAPADEAAPEAAPDKREPGRFDPEQIIDDAADAVEEASEAVEDAFEGDNGDKDRRP